MFRVWWLQEMLVENSLVRQLRTYDYLDYSPAVLTNTREQEYLRQCAVKAPSNTFFQTAVKMSAIYSGAETATRYWYRPDFSQFNTGDRHLDISHLRLTDLIMEELKEELKAGNLMGNIITCLEDLKVDMCCMNVDFIDRNSGIYTFSGQTFRVLTQRDEKAIHIDLV